MQHDSIAESSYRIFLQYLHAAFSNHNMCSLYFWEFLVFLRFFVLKRYYCVSLKYCNKFQEALSCVIVLFCCWKGHVLSYWYGNWSYFYIFVQGNAHSSLLVVYVIEFYWVYKLGMHKVFMKIPVVYNTIVTIC